MNEMKSRCCGAPSKDTFITFDESRDTCSACGQNFIPAEPAPFTPEEQKALGRHVAAIQMANTTSAEMGEWLEEYLTCAKFLEEDSRCVPEYKLPAIISRGRDMEREKWVKLLDRLEIIVGDDACQDFEWRASKDEYTGDAKIMAEKLGRLYMLIHSHNPNHSCYSGHDGWRALSESEKE